MPKTKEAREKEFDGRFHKKYGRENSEICLVPAISRLNKIWLIEIITDDIKSFIDSEITEALKEQREEIRQMIEKTAYIDSPSTTEFKTWILQSKLLSNN